MKIQNLIICDSKIIFDILIEIEEETSGDLLKIIKKIKENKNISEPNKSGSIEDFVLKKIK